MTYLALDSCNIVDFGFGFDNDRPLRCDLTSIRDLEGKARVPRESLAHDLLGVTLMSIRDFERHDRDFGVCGCVRVYTAQKINKLEKIRENKKKMKDMIY